MIFDTLANNIFSCVAACGGVQNLVTVKSFIFLTENFNSCTTRLCEKKLFICNLPAETLKDMLQKVK